MSDLQPAVDSVPAEPSIEPGSAASSFASYSAASLSMPASLSSEQPAVQPSGATTAGNNPPNATSNENKRRTLSKSGKYSLSLTSSTQKSSMRRSGHEQWGAASSAVSPLHAVATPTAGVSFSRRELRPTAPSGTLHGAERIKRSKNPVGGVSRRADHHSPHTLQSNPAHGRHSSSLSDARETHTTLRYGTPQYNPQVQNHVSHGRLNVPYGNRGYLGHDSHATGGAYSAGVSQNSTPRRSRSQIEDYETQQRRTHLTSSSSFSNVPRASSRSSSRGRAITPGRAQAVRPLAHQPQPASSQRPGSRGRQMHASASTGAIPSSPRLGSMAASSALRSGAAAGDPPSPRRSSSRGSRGGDRHIPGAERPMSPARARSSGRGGGGDTSSRGGTTVVYGGGSGRHSRPSPSRPRPSSRGHSPGYTARQAAAQEAFAGQLQAAAAATSAPPGQGGTQPPVSAPVAAASSSRAWLASEAPTTTATVRHETSPALQRPTHQHHTPSAQASPPARQSTAAASWNSPAGGGSAQHEPPLSGHGYVEMHPSGAGVRPKVGQGAAILAGTSGIGMRNYTFETAVQQARFPLATAVPTAGVSSRSSHGHVSPWPATTAPTAAAAAPYTAGVTSDASLRSTDSDVHADAKRRGASMGHAHSSQEGTSAANSARDSTASSREGPPPVNHARGGVHSLPSTAQEQRSVTAGSAYSASGTPLNVAQAAQRQGRRGDAQVHLSPREPTPASGAKQNSSKQQQRAKTASSSAGSGASQPIDDQQHEWYTGSHITVVDDAEAGEPPQAGTTQRPPSRTNPAQQVPTRVVSLAAASSEGAAAPAAQPQAQAAPAHTSPRLTSAVDMGSAASSIAAGTAPRVEASAAAGPNAPSSSTAGPPAQRPTPNNAPTNAVSPSHLTHNGGGRSAAAQGGQHSPPGGDKAVPQTSAHVPESALAPAASAPAQPVNRKERSPVPDEIRRLWLYDFPASVSTNCNPPAHAMRCTMAGHQAMVALVAFDASEHQQTTVSSVTGMQSPYRLLTHERAMVAISRGSRPDPSRAMRHHHHSSSRFAAGGAHHHSHAHARGHGVTAGAVYGSTAAHRRSGGQQQHPPSPFSGGTEASTAMMQRMRNTR